MKDILQKRPFTVENNLLQMAETCWANKSEADFLEAFLHHLKIGDFDSLREKFSSTTHLAASEEILQELAKGNADFQQKFGFIFIVCATGKSAAEMLELLQKRLPKSRERELQIAAGEQAKITRIRLGKLLA